MQTLDFYGEDLYEGPSWQEKYLQHWMSALLLGATKLTSLSVATDCVPWTPVLGLLSIRHLELTMNEIKPWTDLIMADLSICSCLESLRITENMEGGMGGTSMELPELFLHDLATLKSVDLLGWFPGDYFTLSPGCLLRLAVTMEASAQWEKWQMSGRPISMLSLECMELQIWPAGVPEMSGLRYLSLYCKRMQDQDLAALHYIPHVDLVFKDFSTFSLTSGSWQSLQIWSKAGIYITFSNVDAFVRDTQRFRFDCTSQEAGGMSLVLRAACLRQGVPCHAYKQTRANTERVLVNRLSNAKVCRASADRQAAPYVQDECPSCPNGFWPCKTAFPGLFM